MQSPITLVLSTKTLGLSNYKVGNKVWLVTWEPKIRRPFVEGAIIDNALKNCDFYKVKSALEDGLSAKTTPKRLERTIGEMLIVDGLTR
jgi:hypothetical protein